MSDNYKLPNVSSMEKHSHKWQDEAMKSEIHDLKTWIMYVKQLDKYNRKYRKDQTLYLFRYRFSEGMGSQYVL